MAGGIAGGVGAFAEDPAGAVEGFAEREVVGGDVLFASGKSFLGGRELVHQGESMSCFRMAKLTAANRPGKTENRKAVRVFVLGWGLCLTGAGDSGAVRT